MARGRTQARPSARPHSPSPTHPAPAVVEQRLAQLDPDEARRIFAQAVSDERYSHDLVRRLVRATGYRGLDETRISPAVTELLHGAKDTIDRYSILGPAGDAVISPERRDVWESILQSAMGDAQQTLARPRALVLAGGPGSGKSSTRALLASPDAVSIDPDDLMQRLPDYAAFAGLGDPASTAVFYREKKALQGLLFDTALERGVNITVDATGSRPAFLNELQSLADRGYDVDVAYVDCDLTSAISRAAARGRVDGRWMTDEIITVCHAGAAAMWPEVGKMSAVRSLTLMCNSGSDARVVSRLDRQEGHEHLDPARVEEFLEKARGVSDPGVLLGFGPHEIGHSFEAAR